MVLLVLCFGACATTGKGCGPFPSNYETLIRSNLNQILIDPYSAKIDIGYPYSGGHRVLWFKSYGWLVDVYVNSKNRMGGYTGRQKHVYLIRDGKIVKRVGPDHWSKWRH
jgi:hypothetical protein